MAIMQLEVATNVDDHDDHDDHDGNDNGANETSTATTTITPFVGSYRKALANHDKPTARAIGRCQSFGSSSAVHDDY
jgi:hypothetical protein